MLEIYLRAVPFTSMHVYGSAAILELGVADIQNDVTRSFDFNGWSFESRACHVNLVPAEHHVEWRVAFTEIPVGIDLNLFQLNVRGDVDQLEALTFQFELWLGSQEVEIGALFHESAALQITVMDLEGQCCIPEHQPAPPCTCRWILDSINLQLCQCPLFLIRCWRFHTAIHKCEVRHFGFTNWSLVFKDLNSSLEMQRFQVQTGAWQQRNIKVQLCLPLSGPHRIRHCLPPLSHKTQWLCGCKHQLVGRIWIHLNQRFATFLRDWTWYISLRSIRRCHSYPHPQSWGWSPAQRAPTGWRSKRVEPLPSRSTAARSIVPRGIGRSVYETWQEFVSRRNDCSRWNRTFQEHVVCTCTWWKTPFAFSLIEILWNPKG